MQKATNNSEHWRGRTGSFSTHGSRRGVNLLGWEEAEDMQPEQRRECLKAAVKHIDAQLESSLLSPQERRQLGKDKFELCAQMNTIRPKARMEGVQHHFMDAARELLPPLQFKQIMDQACKEFRKSRLKEQS